MTFTPVILFHTVAALGAVAIGGMLLASTKGTDRHRLLGRLWAAMMAAVAISSFWITRGGHYSWIHLLSGWTLFALVMALHAIYKRRIRAHQKWMTSIYAGLAIAGIFTLLPNRRLGNLLWSAVGLA